jgi:hypothetical protein
MSERHQPHGESFTAPKHEQEKQTEQHHTHEYKVKDEEALTVEHIAQKVEQHAVSGKEYSRGETSEHKNHPMLVNRELMSMAYARALTRVRKRLSAPSRTFSKVVHAKAIEKPSEVIGATVARPSGLLGGAFIALIGTSILFWVSRHYGYEYNYLAAVLLFGLGMIVGLSVEGLVHIFKRKTK